MRPSASVAIDSAASDKSRNCLALSRVSFAITTATWGDGSGSGGSGSGGGASGSVDGTVGGVTVGSPGGSEGGGVAGAVVGGGSDAVCPSATEEGATTRRAATRRAASHFTVPIIGPITGVLQSH